MEFKDKLKKLRIEKGLTQKELAELLYCTRSAVAKWENGLGMPNEDSFNRLCEVFNVEKADLLTDEIEETNINKNKKLFLQKRIIISLVSFSSILIICLIIMAVFLSFKPKYVTIPAPVGNLNSVVSNYHSDDKIININNDVSKLSVASVTTSRLSENTLKYLSVVNKSNSYIFEFTNLNDYYYNVSYSIIDNNYNYVKKNELTSLNNYFDNNSDKNQWYEDNYSVRVNLDSTTHKFTLPDIDNMMVVTVDVKMKFIVEKKEIILDFIYYFLIK